MKVTYYFKNRTPKQPKGIHRNDACIFVAYGDWTARSLVPKGMSKTDEVLARRASDQEQKENSHMYRMTFYKYFSWNDFIEDEQRVSSKEVIEELNKIKMIGNYGAIPDNDPYKKH